MSYNHVTSTANLPRAPQLQVLSLLRNRVPATHLATRALGRYPQLRRLTLAGNPIRYTPRPDASN